LWVIESNTGRLHYNVKIYPIGSATPAGSYNATVVETTTPYALTLGIYTGYSPGSFLTIDLSASSLVSHSFSLPSGNFSSNSIVQSPLIYGGPEFAATSPTHFVKGTSFDQIVDGSSLAGTPRYFGLGALKSVAGGASRAALALGIGQVRYFDPSSSTP